MRITSANILLGAAWQGAWPAGLPQTVVVAYLDPGEAPTPARFVQQAARLLNRELGRPLGDRNLGQAVLEAEGLMELGAAEEHRQGGFGLSSRSARRLFARMLPLAAKCASQAQGPEAREDALFLLKNIERVIAAGTAA